ncbi:hypothetical protein THRCLA_07143 [Thraustotheca clavata]|uniref:MSP domain-containing protein n=1 Tax=Thraustotheca clavata TaxID=74557 RepID=A0A1V9ZGA5_9STRA|nr:hypothetical protein THRCLA_07143 [Thraustotheca clavata]
MIAYERQLCNDKFLIESIVIDSNGAIDKINELWSFAKSGGNIGYANVFCQYKQDDDINTHASSNQDTPITARCIFFHKVYKSQDDKIISYFVKMSTMDHGITVEPTDFLTFSLSVGSTPQAALIITNQSSVDNVAFKVKTTRPMRYLVRPNQGIIRPNSVATVLVILQQKDCDELTRMNVSERQLSNDKFLVQSIGVDAEFCDLLTTKSPKDVMDDLTALWAAPGNKKIGNKKLRCRFEDAKDGEINTPAQLTSALLETKAEPSPPSSNKSLTSQPSVYASTAEESIRQEMMAEMAVLRKKYDELVAFTVQLTAQRDTLMSDLDKARQQNQKLSTEQQRMKRQASDISTLRQRRPEAGEDQSSPASPVRSVPTPSPAKPLTLFHILICAILFFLIGRYYG